MRKPLILCYHAIGASWPSAVIPELLRGHVKILLRRGYRGMTFIDAVTAAPGRRVFAITFDDAYASVLDQAYPILASMGVPATVFVVTSFAEAGSPLDWPGLRESGVSGDPAARASLSWGQLRTLAEAGWEVGSHTCTHPHLTLLDDETLERELRQSRESCTTSLGTPCRSIAYPYGDLDARVTDAAGAAGYEAGCSLSVTTSGALAWPRIGMYGVDSATRFRMKVSPTVLMVRRALAGAR